MKKSKQTPASLVWFEIPADDIARAKKFYQALFGLGGERKGEINVLSAPPRSS